jgi:hypothetical protein
MTAFLSAVKHAYVAPTDAEWLNAPVRRAIE